MFKPHLLNGVFYLLMNLKILIVGFILISLNLKAQKIRRVSGDYSMKIESNMSENKAVSQVVQQAKINALENEFGTRVGMMNQIRMENANGQTNTSFSSISNSLIKGIWLKDLEEPDIQKFDLDGDRWIKAEVVGRARSLENAGVSLEVKTLKCPNINCESQDFNQNDGLILYFRSPESGYLSAYIDDKSTTFMTMPYMSMDGGSVPIEADKEYFLFVADEKYNYFNQDKAEIDEYYLYTPHQYEVDLLYVLFSKEQFSKPILENNGPGIPKTTTSKAFNDWLAEIMSYENMFMEVIDINISN